MANIANTDYFFYGNEDELNRFKNEVLLKTSEEQAEMGCFIGWPADENFEIIERTIDSEVVNGIEASYESKWDSNVVPLKKYLAEKNYDIKVLYIAYSSESEFCYSNDINKNIWNSDVYVICNEIFEDFMESEAFMTSNELSEKLKLMEKVMESDEDDEWQAQWKEFLEENENYGLEDLISKAEEYAELNNGYLNILGVGRRADDLENDFDPNEFRTLLTAMFSDDEEDSSEQLDFNPSKYKGLIDSFISRYASEEEDDDATNDVDDDDINTDDEDLTNYDIVFDDREVIVVPDGVLHVFCSASPYDVDKTKVRKVVLPEGLKSIGTKTFFSCSNLEEINLPDSIEEIGEDAFSGNFNIKAFKLPQKLRVLNPGVIPYPVVNLELNEGLEEINSYPGPFGMITPLKSMINLKKIVIPSTLKNLPQGALADNGKLEEIVLKCKLSKIEQKTFRGCSSLKRIEIPKGVKTIGKEAFRYCTSLEEVILPSTITEIKDYAFAGCESLKTINLSECKKLKKLGRGSFSGCSFEKIDGLENLKSIGSYCFSKCHNLYDVILPDTIESIGEDVFWHCRIRNLKINQFEIKDGLYIQNDTIDCTDVSIKNVVIPSGVKYISDQCFRNCEKLESISIPESVEEIGDYAFAGCTSLTEITLPDSLNQLDEIFADCSNLEKVSLPKALRSLYGTFKNCSNLSEICMPDSVSIIGRGTFQGCSKLKIVKIPESVTQIGEEAFADCSNLDSISIPESVKEIGPRILRNCRIKNFKYKALEIRDGFEIKINSDEDISLISNTDDSRAEIKVPEYITSIDEYAFSNSTTLEKISFANPKIKADGSEAFSNCKALKEFDFPPLMQVIPWNYFDGCSSLEIVTIPDSIEHIEYRAFANCKTLTKVILPAKLKEISQMAFLDCDNLTSVDFKNNSDVSIYPDAFNGCKKLDSKTTDFLEKKFQKK